jgi:hypothetical protein
MKIRFAAWAGLAISVWQFSTPAQALYAQEQSPCFRRPSECLRRLYYKITGTDVRSFDVDPDCEVLCDPPSECLQRIPCDDCVRGKKKLFCGSICYENVTVAEVRYRWKTKWITKEVPADFEEPICNTDDQESLHCVEDWKSGQWGECKIHCRSMTPAKETVEQKRIDCQPGKTTVKLCYKSCVKVPYTVYRQIKRPIAIKQPCCEKVEVPVKRYACECLESDCECVESE